MATRGGVAGRWLMLSLGITGCVSGGRAWSFETAARDSSLVWPSPPDSSRVRYLLSISTPSDVGVRKSFFRRVAAVFSGATDERIKQPSAVAVDSGGRIYVADVQAHGVHMFDPAAGQYRLITRVGHTNLKWPIGLAVDPAGNVYISDSEARAVFSIDRDGRERFEIDTGFVRPTGIAYDAAAGDGGRLYVVDTNGHRIVVFDAAGHTVATFGERGTEGARLNYPVNVTIGGGRGWLYVTDAMNFSIKEFTSDGRYLFSFGEATDAVGGLPRPKGVALDSEGHLYVVEGLYDVVNIYDTLGRLLLTFGGPGHGAGEFWLATGVAIDRRDRVYVADSYNGRVQVFQYVSRSE